MLLGSIVLSIYFFGMVKSYNVMAKKSYYNVKKDLKLKSDIMLGFALLNGFIFIGTLLVFVSSSIIKG